MNKWFQFCFIAMGIIQSKRKVNMAWFKRFCHNAQVHLKTHFRWANIGYATHEIFSHVADFMEEFGGTGLGHLSEVQCSNSSHSFFKRNFVQFWRTITIFMNSLPSCSNIDFGQFQKDKNCHFDKIWETNFGQKQTFKVMHILNFYVKSNLENSSI